MTSRDSLIFSQDAQAAAPVKGTVEIQLAPEHPHLEEFFKSYVRCALFTDCDENGRTLDESYSMKDFDDATLVRMREDCKKFLRLADPADIPGVDDVFRAGYDFYFTRNSHGSGFWDGDWPEGPAVRLTKLAKSFGSFSVMVGDDGNLVGTP